MKAIVYTQFGSPNVLQLKMLGNLKRKKGEGLIKIFAAAVAKEDPEMRASPGLNGLRSPKKPILGSYLAGEIEMVGRNIKRFRKGDQVFGSTFSGAGAYAEYLCMPAGVALAAKAVNMTYEEAAAGESNDYH